jgi:uncharacterized protein (TIGR02145 family)
MKNKSIQIFPQFIYLFLLSVLFLPLDGYSQTPALIPYQAVLRNPDGSVMGDIPVSITFRIHDNTPSGTVLFEENHITNTTTQGLIGLNIGGGTVVTGTFSNINWGNGGKFLQVLLNTGSGSSTTVDLGTQQMMSVPYALYAEDVKVRVSASGDSLFIGEAYSIVPGVSAANVVGLSNYGSVLLPGNTSCINAFISVTGCNGVDSLLYNGAYYDLVEIGGQCWFAENLSTTLYKDGTNIPNVTGSAAWGALTTPSYCWYNNNSSLISSYLDGKMGALYNAYAVETNNLCPTGWHVPSDCEWMYLENHLGLNVSEQMMAGWRGSSINLAGQLKTVSGWTSPNAGANNASGFSAIPAGIRMGTASATFAGINNYSYWWTSSSYDASSYWSRSMYYSEQNLERASIAKRAGYSVRCVKD